MVATRFYLSSSTAAACSPSFYNMTRTSDGDRRNMSPTKDGSTLTDKTFWGNTSPSGSSSCTARQFVSDQMAAGIAFTTSNTFKLVVRCKESAINDNISVMLMRVAVFSDDGATLRTAIHTGIQGSANEWATSLTNRKISGTCNQSYTTVANDRLVIDVGGKVDGTGGTSVTGTMSFGSSAGADLADDETSTTANDPWFEIDVDCFPSAPSGQPTSKRFGGVPFMGAHGAGIPSAMRQWMRRDSGLIAPQVATGIWRPAHG